MELKDFIKSTLEQIVEGTVLANEVITEKGGTLNPSRVKFQKDGLANNFYHAMPQDVNFDVGLTTTGKDGSTEGVGVFLGAVSLGKKNDTSVEQIAITRVKFTIPLVLPPGKKMIS